MTENSTDAQLSEHQNEAFEVMALRSLYQMYEGEPCMLPGDFATGYLFFLKDFFDSQSRTVLTETTPSHKYIYLAGAHRFSLDHSTGLIAFEIQETLSQAWVPHRGQSLITFFKNSRKWQDMLKAAYEHRLKPFVAGSLEQFDVTQRLFAERYFELACERAAWGRTGFNHKGKLLTAILAKEIWINFLDRKTAALAHAYFGSAFTLGQYNLVVRHRSALTQISSESPNVRPFIGRFLSKTVDARDERDVPRDLTLKVKRELLTAGLSEAGWRFLLRTSISAAHVLAFNYFRFGDRGPLGNPCPTICCINLLASTGVKAPPLFGMRVVRLFDALEDAVESGPEGLRFIRLAGSEAVHARHRGRLRLFLNQDFPLCVDWFISAHREGNGRPFLPKNWSWATVMRAQRQWHIEGEARRIARELADAEANNERRKALELISWDCALSSTVIHDIQIEPLTTALALNNEADQMRHCVDDYVPRCLKGFSQVFSLRSATERATLELNRANVGEWRVAQIHSYENMGVSPQMMRVGTSVARLYTQANLRG